MTSSPPRWSRHFVYRSERLRTTWKLRLGVLLLVVAVPWLTRGWWTEAIGRSLVCEDSKLAAADAIVIENFDPDYLLFERATQLRRAGVAQRVLVPVAVGPGKSEPNDVAAGIAEMMARIARLGAFEVLPIHETEPISLTAARDIQRFLERERIRSVVVVSPLFRSRRTSLVYAATVSRAGITVGCDAVQEARTPGTWTRTWHGIEDVVQQWLKLQYYRLYVLPFRS